MNIHCIQNTILVIIFQFQMTITKWLKLKIEDGLRQGLKGAQIISYTTKNRFAVSPISCLLPKLSIFSQFYIYAFKIDVVPTTFYILSYLSSVGMSQEFLSQNI